MDTQFLPATVELAWDIRCGTGESPVWAASRGELLFADIPAGRIHAYNPGTGARTSWRLPGLVASFGLCRSGRLVVAMRDRIVLYDLDRERMEVLAGPLPLPEATRFNDGKVGPDGAFWVGTIETSPARAATSHLYRVTADGGIEAKVSDIVNSNGLAWSPDGRTMFHADTRPGVLTASDFDPATGALANRREIARLPDADGRPDGGATDSEGCYWSAGVSAAWLNRFAPSGALVGRVALPYPAPTMPCFTPHGLFVTSLRDGRDPAVVAAHPTMGGLLRIDVAFSGAPVGLFADSLRPFLENRMSDVPTKPVLLTGASGALGRKLAAFLGARGWTLRLTDIAPFPDPIPAGGRFVRADLEDGVAMLRLAEGCGMILHFGGVSVERPFEEVIGPNIRGVYHIYEAARREGARVLFASSNHSIGYHERDEVLDDDCQPLPDGYYGVSKVYAEMLGRMYWFKHGVESVSVRIGSCFPEPVEQRMLSTWLSYDDLGRLCERATLAAATGCAVIWGASANSRTFWREDSRALIGWEPQDSADAYENKVMGIVSGNPVVERYQGGSYTGMDYSRSAPPPGRWPRD